MPRTLALVLLLACERPAEEVVPLALDAPVRSCTVVVSREIPVGVSAGAVAGSFSDWQPIELVDDDGDGVGEAVLGELDPGTYAYKFVWDGVYEGAPSMSEPTAWSGDVENRGLVVADCDLPDVRPVQVEVRATDARVTFQWSQAGDRSPLLQVEATVAGVALDPDDVQVDDRGEIVVDVPLSGAGKRTVRLRATDQSGRTVQAQAPMWAEPEPFAWTDGVLYLAFLDRFRDGGPGPEVAEDASPGATYRGGDLVGLADALDEGWFDELGVRALWLSPVADNPSGAFAGAGGEGSFTGYHGYWPVDVHTVERRLGTTDVAAADALHRVVQSAHDRGMRVLLDVVLNHVHEQHPWVQDHPEWFDLDAPCVCGEPGCGWEERTLTCRFAPYLPDVSYREPAAVDAALDEVMWWVETFDVDGLRLDAVKHMDPVVVRALNRRVRERLEVPGAPPFYLVGETFTGAGAQDQIMAYVGEHALDGQFDFPLLWRIRDALRDDGSFWPLSQEVDRGDALYGPAARWMSPFVGNHDVPRVATEVSGCDEGATWLGCDDLIAMDDPRSDAMVDRLAMAWAFVVTQPGPPLLYYGDEIGLAGGEDPDNRRDMVWGGLSLAQQDLLDQVQQLGQLRAASEALRRGGRRTLLVDDNAYVYARVTGDQAAIVVLSRQAEGTWWVDVPGDVAPEGTELVDADGEVRRVEGGRLAVDLEPWGWQVWQRR